MPSIDRRQFLQAASLALPAASYSRVLGANDRIGVAFLGTGGRAQAHIDLINRLRDERFPVAPAAVCDVWDGLEGEYDHTFDGKTYRRKYAQGLYPSAKKAGLDPDDRRHVVKDYRRVLELKDVDVVCIAAPDHWHARMTIDAALAGKHVYCERPMTRTADEAIAVLDAVRRNHIVMTVGTQALADPTWVTANEAIRRGRIGPVVQAQGGAFRSDPRGMWRFYRVVPEMNPHTIDWDLFLGRGFAVTDGVPLAPELPFDHVTFAQWRCHSALSGGIFTDSFVPTIARLAVVLGVTFPRRVTASGGLYHEHDGRGVPDVATLVAEYEEGFQLLLTGSTVAAHPMDEVVRGRAGAIRFVKGGFEIVGEESVRVEGPRNETLALWEDFLDCVRRRDRDTLSPPESGAAAAVTAALGWSSYRTGRSIEWKHDAV